MALSALLGCLPAASATLATPDLADMTLEQLSSVIVTSVSRREQPLSSAAASIYVISAEDIRRSGATILPEAELARRLRENRAHAAMVLVAVTGWGQARDKARATQAGFDYHLVKPLDPQHLAVILQTLDRKDPASRLETSISGA